MATGVQGRRCDCLGEAFFVSMLLLGCSLESSINGLGIGLNACCYSHGGRFWGRFESSV